MELKKRKSLILHFDSLDIIDELNKDQIADLFIAIRDYNLWKDIKLEGLMKAVFIPLKNQFDRDIDKYIKKCEVNAINGSKWGRPKETQENPVALVGKNNNPYKAYNKNKNNSKSNKDNKEINISKDITTEVVEKPTYWNEEINSTLEFLQKAVWVDEFKESKKWQRVYWKHFVWYINKQWKEDFIERLKWVLADDFKSKNCNSIKYLYNEVKSYIYNPVIQEERKIKSY